MIKEDNFLFYVTTNDNDNYSVFNRLTDNLILSEVTEIEVSNFLSTNNPSHPFINTYDAPSMYPHKEDIAGLSYIQSNWDAYPWDTLPSVYPSYEQMHFDFENKKEVTERIKEIAREVLPTLNDCEDDTD
tara:strand:+ start:3718 stop:4107 length:390 start_codon:yes stop_codon:yes gene_type:complete